MTDTSQLAWRKSSRSGASDCVEVADGRPELVAVRDSKDPSGPVLSFPTGAWRDFVSYLKH